MLYVVLALLRGNVSSAASLGVGESVSDLLAFRRNRSGRFDDPRSRTSGPVHSGVGATGR